MIETDNWPFMKAMWFTEVAIETPRTVDLIVLHDMEYPEKWTAAEDVGKYFMDPRDEHGKPVKASSHIGVDADSIVQYVHDKDVAFGAPGCNRNGIQIEFSGYGRQTRDQWLDDYSRAMLDRGANAVAQYCLKFNVPPVHLTDRQLGQGLRGIIGHVQASNVFHGSDHTDPGPNFPWDIFIASVEQYLAKRKVAHGVV